MCLLIGNVSQVSDVDHGLLVSYFLCAAAAVAQSVRAFTLQVEGWVFGSHLLQTKVVKTGSDSSTAKRLTTGVSVMGPRRLLPCVTVGVAR